MAIEHPNRSPSDREGCMEALNLGFELLVKEASWAGWDVEATAESLLELAENHKHRVQRYRENGRLPADDAS